MDAGSGAAAGDRLIVASDALAAWGNWPIDQGYRGMLECIVAKIFGSESQKEAAIELFKKTHGGTTRASRRSTCKRLVGQRHFSHWARPKSSWAK